MQANWLTKTAIIYTFFTLSLFTSVLSTFVLQAVNYYHVSNASAGALESYQNITQIFLSFVAFSVLLNLGYKRAMIIMLSLMTLLCLAMPFLNYFWILRVYLVFLGFALVFLKIGVYSSVGLVTNSQKNHAFFVAIIETTWMVASVVGMWILSFFLHQINWLNAFWVFAVFGVLNVVLWLAAPLNEDALKTEKDKKISAQLKDLGHLFKSKLILSFIVIAFVAGLVEQGINAWLPAFYRGVINLPSSYSVQLASLLLLSMALGRVIIIFLLNYMRWDKILLLFYACGALFLIVILNLVKHDSGIVINSWADVPLVALLFPLIGLFIAPTSPILNSTILSTFPKAQHTLVMTVITIFGALTGSVAARLLGGLFDWLGGIQAFQITTIVPLILVALVILPYGKMIIHHKAIISKQEENL
mgnify:FL=1